MEGLISLFDTLPNPLKNSDRIAVFSGIRVPNTSSWHLCKDSKGYPLLLISIANSPSERIPADLVLENLRVEHNIECQISSRDGSRIGGRFSIIRCLSNERALHEYFLLTMNAIISSLPTKPDISSLSKAVENLTELFHLLLKAPTRPLQGLWAELFLIIQSANPTFMIKAWHIDADERFDFSFGDQRIEVKSSSNRNRQHHFSFEQAYPPEGTKVLIVSIFLERSTNGLALGELWDKARDIAVQDPESLIKIEKICLEALGNTWLSARAKCFDQFLATHSLKFYFTDDIPRISPELPEGVSEIRFRSNLDLAPQADIHLSNSDVLFDILLGIKAKRIGDK